MKIVIMGGGKLGAHLAENMLESKHTVRLIERDKNRCQRLANELDAVIICGDGTELGSLTDAETEDADCFIAVTGRDQDNLVACQLAKRQFHVKRVIARVNNPRNSQAMKAFGADIAVSSTEVITSLIEQEVDVAEMHLLATLNKGRAGICAITLPDDTALRRRTLNEISLPAGTLIISIVRGDALIIPNGSTMMQPRDEVVAVCAAGSQKELLRILSGRA
ncbi:MAG: TrkA family potassium uptake protein [Hydrogeniiclostridium sp.]